MCAMHRIRMLHNQAYTRYSSLCIPYLVLFIPSHLRVSTTISSQVCELQGSPMFSYFSRHSGTLSPP
jgi:hypothetical protein